MSPAVKSVPHEAYNSSPNTLGDEFGKEQQVRSNSILNNSVRAFLAALLQNLDWKTECRTMIIHVYT